MQIKRSVIALGLSLIGTITFGICPFSFLKNKSQSSAKFVTEQQFKSNTKKQLEYAPQTLAQLRKIGVTSDKELKLEYFFYTNTIEKARNLSTEIGKLGYIVRYDKAKSGKDPFVITGWSNKMKMDNKTIGDWTTFMCTLGYKFDCDFDGWGTSPDMGPNKSK